MRVLWLCNSPISDMSVPGTGSWLSPLAAWLLESGGVELGVIASSPVKKITQNDYRGVKQWIIPSRTRLGNDGLPPTKVIRSITLAVSSFAPDLLHCWGTEYFWGLLLSRGIISYPVLLEIQGIKDECAKHYYGDLSALERLSCIGPREVLKRRTLRGDRRIFSRWGQFEEEAIRFHRHIDVQSKWIENFVKALNPDARLFRVDLALRTPFYETTGWHPHGGATVFCIVPYPLPYKGLHVAIRALRLLKIRIRNARLKIAGAHQHPGIRQSGYIRWINRMIRQYDLTESIEWLGMLDAKRIVSELENADAAVIPTFIENCCTAMQETMAVGTPLIVSNVGGIPSLGEDGVSCLFFTAGDEAQCAIQLERALTDTQLALQLSRESRRIAAVRNNRDRIVKMQMDVYRQVLKDANS